MRTERWEPHAQQVLDRAEIDLDEAARGCVVVGPRYAGKSTVLEILRQRLDGPAVTVDGVQRSAGLVFGTLLHTREDLVDLDPPRLRWAVAAALRERGTAAVFVDNADQLDDDAAAIIHALAVHDEVPVFIACTPEPEGRVPAALRALWKDGHLPRVDLLPISEREVRDCLVDAVGHPVTTRDVASFTRWSRGQPGLLVDLVSSSLQADQWQVIAGTALLTERPAASSLVLEEIEALYADLNDDVLAVVEVFGAVLPILGGRLLDWLPLLPMIELFGMDAMVEAERCGVIAADEVRVRLVAPYLVDVVARYISPLRRAQLARDLAGAVAAAAAAGSRRDRDDQNRTMTGLLSVALSDAMAVSELRDTARSAQRLGDPTTVLALTAQDHLAPGADRELAVIHTWALIDVNDVAGLETMLRHWHADPLPAWQGLVDFRATFRTRRELGGRAFLARYDAQRGGLLGVVDEWLRRDQLSGAWLGFLIAETAVLIGRYHDARLLLDRTIPAAGDNGLLIFHLGMVEIRLTTMLTSGGHACEIAENAKRDSGWRSDYLCAVADFVCALAHVSVGRFDQALAELRESAPFVAGPGLDGSAEDLLQRIGDMMGDSRKALEPNVIDACEDSADPCALQVASEHMLDAAWAMVAAGEWTTAVERLLDFGERIIDAAPTLALDQLELAARFAVPGEVAVARRLVSAAQSIELTVDSAWRVDALLAYVTAIGAGEGEALATIAQRYRAAGLLPVAADAFAQAAVVYGNVGDADAALVASGQARSLVRTIGGLASPAQRRVEPPPLTKREREVAALVAACLSNREIAERLQLSVRTVEGHLLRACAKFGLRTRDELGHLWREGMQ